MTHLYFGLTELRDPVVHLYVWLQSPKRLPYTLHGGDGGRKFILIERCKHGLDNGAEILKYFTRPTCVVLAKKPPSFSLLRQRQYERD